uniref:Uncharacterized protein n=1 Tax=Arundo donax TaxID=35708 RepID=A0A0A9E103_ARUDO
MSLHISFHTTSLRCWIGGSVTDESIKSANNTTINRKRCTPNNHLVTVFNSFERTRATTKNNRN